MPTAASTPRWRGSSTSRFAPHLGRGWGKSDDPDCSGIAVEDFSRVDLGAGDLPNHITLFDLAVDPLEWWEKQRARFAK